MAGAGSIAVEEVVPTVAQTKHGVCPARRSSSMARSSASGRIAWLASTSIRRTFRRPIPAMPAAFSSDECAWVEVYAVRTQSTPVALVRNAVARSRAASSAHNEALEAVSWITPPPCPLDLNRSGSPSMSTSQSSTCVSSSVQAGLVAHSIPCTPNPEETRSPSIAGGDAFPGKYAKKLGDCQCVTPGRITSSRSWRIASNASPRSGGCAGRRRRTSPGATWASTG